MSKDPGLQPFMLKEDESFVEFTQRTTWFDAMTKAMQKHSELMQPWKDDYPQMEYGYPEIPNWDPEIGGGDVPGDKPPGCDSCHFSAMWFDGPNGCEDAQFCVPYGGKFCMDAETDAAYTEFKKTGVAPEGFGDEITRWSSLAAFAAAMATSGISVNQLSGTPQGYAPAGYIRSDRLRKLGQSTVMSNTKKLCESCWLCIGAWDGTWDFTDGDITFRAEITDSYGNRCRDEKTLRCLCCDQPSYTAVTFDEATTPDTVARSNSITITAQDGCPPYTWSETGTDFSLASTTTMAVTNTLTAGASACGKCTITITDKCGNTDTTYVRCTTGSWQNEQHICGISGYNDEYTYYDCLPYRCFEWINGGEKQTEQVTWHGKGCNDEEVGNETLCCSDLYDDSHPELGTWEYWCANNLNQYGLKAQGQCIIPDNGSFNFYWRFPVYDCYMPSDVGGGAVYCWDIKEMSYFVWGC